ncbi:helicase-related protein [Paraferrimonas sp. SM1919]|uniref:helicase-related protein n=1 Tax=Paraferrimonas sp. SM1919 TaxID=2662263 RepID=UPI0013CFC98A|nr:helicase-related protein [Paraferrimonas sp. SM1919]
MTLPSLPIDPLKSKVIANIANHHLVVAADTGSGKSTRLPLWLAAAGYRVLIVEPRRIAATALANYLSQSSAFAVNYAIRFENHVTANTQLAFVTPGVALSWLADNNLQDFDVVMIDEFHERRWDTDLLLAILKQKQSHKLLLTSATINAQALTRYIDGQYLFSEGKRFSVELKHLAKDDLQLPSNHNLEQRVATAVDQALAETQGDVLVFLPGKKELASCQQACQHFGISSFPLHGGIESDIQQQILSPANERRIIFATNVAETSLTIEGVTAVVDSGLERRTIQRNGRNVLSLERISMASAKQRLGRAGRVQAGVCYRLWGQAAPLDAHTDSELMRQELLEPMLAAANNGFELASLEFLDSLKPKTLEIAKQALLSLSAIDSQGQITEHGKRLGPLPIDAIFAHLLSSMPDLDCTQLMIDCIAVMSTPGRLYQLPNDPYDIDQLQQWQHFDCDAYTQIKLLREGAPDCLKVNHEVLREARTFAKQLRLALDIPLLSKQLSKDSSKLLTNTQLRERWILALLKAHPQMAFVRREKRQQALANGIQEVQIGRDSRFEIAKETHPSAIVLNIHSVPGRGVKQTLNLATVLIPVSLQLLCKAELGQEQLNADGKLERIYAGRVIGVRQAQLNSQHTGQLVLQQILSGERYAGLAEQLQQDIASYNLWLKVTGEQGTATSLEAHLSHTISELGIETMDDLELVEADDFAFAGIPDWQKSEFMETYPLALTLAELKLTVEYFPAAKRVVVHYASGTRKAGPKRWELPRFNGWRVQYRKASKLVDVK